jgi:hypothetical protein
MGAVGLLVHGEILFEVPSGRREWTCDIDARNDGTHTGIVPTSGPRLVKKPRSPAKASILPEETFFAHDFLAPE